jgi:hypothetical protein
VQPAVVVAEVLARMEAGSIQRPRCAYNSDKRYYVSSGRSYACCCSAHTSLCWP